MQSDRSFHPNHALFTSVSNDHAMISPKICLHWHAKKFTLYTLIIIILFAHTYLKVKTNHEFMYFKRAKMTNHEPATYFLLLLQMSWSFKNNDTSPVLFVFFWYFVVLMNYSWEASDENNLKNCPLPKKGEGDKTIFGPDSSFINYIHLVERYLK